MNYHITTNTNIEITPARFQEAMARYAQAGLRGLEINKAIEAEINEVMERYEHQRQCNDHIRTTAYATIRSYCTDNKKLLFGKRRKMGTPYGVVGFRLASPRLRIPKNTPWSIIKEQLKKLLPEYVRTVEEPAKDMLLANRNKETVARALMQMNIEVVQEELFYIDTKQAA
jgi:phage host-nuclease inhibitor protein Gam